MIDELYINGMKADMQSDSNIYFTFRSNYFTELGKVVSNYSNTISLPRTTKNMQGIDSCMYVGGNSPYPYIRHNASVYRDGVPIVINADLYLTKISSSSIEVVLIWGSSTNLKQLASKGKKLNELNELYNGEQVYSTIQYRTTSSNTNRFYPTYVDGLKYEDRQYHLPVIPVEDIIKGIANDAGVTINYARDGYKEFAIPITSLVGYEGNFAIKTNNASFQSSNYDVLPILVKGSQSSLRLDNYISSTYYSIYNDIAYAFKNYGDEKRNALFTLSAEIYIPEKINDGEANIDDITLIFGGKKAGGNIPWIWDEQIIKSIKPSTKSHSAGLYYLRFNENFEFEMEAGYEITCYLYANGKIINCTNPSSICKTDIVLSAKSETKQIDFTTANYISVKGNLPEIEYTKFLGAIANMLGLFAVAQDNQIDFISYDSLFDFTQAKDWSEYLITNKDWIPTIEFSTGVEAKKNYFKYKNADEKDWDYTFEVENEYLDEEKTLVELPFKTYQSNDGKAYFPLWKYEDNVLEFNEDDSPYIVKVADGYATSNELKWSTLFNAYYSNLRNIYSKAKVITEKFILSNVILNDVNLGVPIYLSQYGAFFGIIEIKTRANNIAEVKLVKLNS